MFCLGLLAVVVGRVVMLCYLVWVCCLISVALGTRGGLRLLFVVVDLVLLRFNSVDLLLYIVIVGVSLLSMVV